LIAAVSVSEARATRPDLRPLPHLLSIRFVRSLLCSALALGVVGFVAARASAEALLVIDAESGRVVHAENAGHPWYPASITKVMTAYLTLQAVREGRLMLDTTIKVTGAAAAQQPVKMGFPVGTLVTVDNALKMMMVRSSNDMAVVLAEGVSGSIETFSVEMNATARRLGMVQSSFVNPNGLPDEEQVTSARDLAILARALIRDFPEYEHYWHIPAIKFGKRVMSNYNSLIGRYPGADGMKTGFICASGFNLVASATRGGKRMIAVVLGASSSQARAMKAAPLLERGFNSTRGINWLIPSLGTVESIQPVNAEPVNLREDMCGAHRKRRATEDEDEVLGGTHENSDTPYGIFLASLRPKAKGEAPGPAISLGEPVVVYTGRARKPGDPPPAAANKPKKSKPPADATAKAGTKTDTKTAAAKPTGAKSETVKSTAKPAAPKDTASKGAQTDAAPATRPKPKKSAPKPLDTGAFNSPQTTQAR
jgi:D-alanyl-D-alanine carboxypeptidase